MSERHCTETHKRACNALSDTAREREPVDLTWQPANGWDRVTEQPDADWPYGNSPAGLRQRAAEELAAEFGNDVSEWTV